uniref:Methionine biosynthesis protein MetW n=1 Tax=Candidatus Kentrum eta TaxID=2126337 RepID=A0A450VIF1_9GAMM|nr:MAG: methionine biosynthesis protein MetW [Candidatus Kentron sp. H]VFK04535.1 MAG: methionine biosynthesis protein MetW [Candidatus Kentron sp. H]VFK07580.1 MAG: methionine biosynthesis protein MetW [Candidatus Kentron sp. H]
MNNEVSARNIRWDMYRPWALKMFGKSAYKVLRRDLAIISQWIAPDSRILDLGCGDGTLLIHLRDQSSVKGYGLEIDNRHITQCVAAGLNVIQGNLDEGLSNFDANSFDYVIMTQTLQAVRSPERLLLEMLRVGREGIVTFPNLGHWSARIQIALQGKMPVSKALSCQWYDTQNIHLCTVKDFEQLCSKNTICILQRVVVDVAHNENLLTRLFPNLFGEIAIYRLCKS